MLEYLGKLRTGESLNQLAVGCIEQSELELGFFAVIVCAAAAAASPGGKRDA
jgi:hypothetical protein